MMLPRETDIYDTIGYFKVSVANKSQTIETDGYDETLIPSRATNKNVGLIFHLAQNLQGWLHTYIAKVKPGTIKTSWDVSISANVRSQLECEGVRDFLSAIETLPTALRRNLSGIHEISGLSKLAQSIEMNNTLAVADASIGTRGRASHAYIVESRCGRYRVIGVAPVDCDEDDLESTRAELWGQIALQTIINILCEQFGVISGQVDVYGDNKDSLVKNYMTPSKTAATSRQSQSNRHNT